MEKSGFYERDAHILQTTEEKPQEVLKLATRATGKKKHLACPAGFYYGVLEPFVHRKKKRIKILAKNSRILRIISKLWKRLGNL